MSRRYINIKGGDDVDFSIKDIINPIKFINNRKNIKLIAGIVGTLIILFFYTLGYSFLYGFYFGNGSSISLLDMGLSGIPINFKFVSTIGAIVLALNCIFILPINKMYRTKTIKMKLSWIIIIVVLSCMSLIIFKMLVKGTCDINLKDIYFIMVLLGLYSYMISLIYIGDNVSHHKIKLLISFVIAVLLAILAAYVVLFNNTLKSYLIDIVGLLVIIVIPLSAFVFSIMISFSPQKQIDTSKAMNKKENINKPLLWVFILLFCKRIIK